MSDQYNKTAAQWTDARKGKILLERGYSGVSPGFEWDAFDSELAALLRQVAADRQEACAQVSDEITMRVPGGKRSAHIRCLGWDISAAIRALSTSDD